MKEFREISGEELKDILSGRYEKKVSWKKLINDFMESGCAAAELNWKELGCSTAASTCACAKVYITRQNLSDSISVHTRKDKVFLVNKGMPINKG